MTKTLKDKIIEQVERLAPPQQEKVLDFARGLTKSPVIHSRDLLRFAGSIPPADLKEMTRGLGQTEGF